MSGMIGMARVCARMLVWTAPDGIERCQAVIVQSSKRSRPMRIIRVGLDTSKQVFQVHGVDEADQPVLRRQVRRGEMEKVFAKLPATRIGLEACGASHHWARVLRGLGHEVTADAAAIRQALRQARQERRD
jgi:transposase